MGDNRLEPVVLSDASVTKWRARFLVGRLDGLGDEPRPGCLARSLMPRWTRTRHDQREVSCHPVKDWSSSPGSTASLAATRPSLTPRWNPASRSRASAGDLFGTPGCVLGMEPGTRFAFGNRLGRPAVVGAPEIGASTVSAARQPSSAGDDQRRPTAAVTPGEPGASRLPLNQRASTESKMGSRRVAADGTMTSPPAELGSGFRGAASSNGAEVSCDVPVPPDAGEPEPDSPAVTAGPTCETGRTPSADAAGPGR